MVHGLRDIYYPLVQRGHPQKMPSLIAKSVDSAFYLRDWNARGYPWDDLKRFEVREVSFTELIRLFLKRDRLIQTQNPR